MQSIFTQWIIDLSVVVSFQSSIVFRTECARWRHLLHSNAKVYFSTGIWLHFDFEFKIQMQLICFWLFHYFCFVFVGEFAKQFKRFSFIKKKTFFQWKDSTIYRRFKPSSSNVYWIPWHWSALFGMPTPTYRYSVCAKAHWCRFGTKFSSWFDTRCRAVYIFIYLIDVNRVSLQFDLCICVSSSLYTQNAPVKSIKLSNSLDQITWYSNVARNFRRIFPCFAFTHESSVWDKL